MILGSMLEMLGFNIDDVAIAKEAVRFLNAGQNRMAIEVGASFPQLNVDTDPELKSTFIFPEKYHEIPVLYASAMYKSQDSSVGEKNSLLNQFEQGVANFSENYDPPVQYLDGPNVQQFVATAGQTNFIITKEGFHAKWGNPRYYINNIPVDKLLTAYNGNTITLPATLVGDKVTIIWEQHSDYTVQPFNYPGW